MKSLSVDLLTFKWPLLHWDTALRRVPAVALCLGLGIAFGQPAAGVVAAGAALSVGFAAMRSVRGSRFMSMGGTILAMALSAWVGTRMGGSHWLSPLLTALWAFGFALLTVYDEDIGWIAMQGVLTLVVASAFPSRGVAAGERAGVILAGGVIQFATLATIWYFRGILHPGDEKAPEGKPGPLHGYEHDWKEFSKSFHLQSIAFQYALRVALTMVLAVEAGRYLPIKNGYWLPMTTLVILKPDFYRTYSGGVQRVTGTLLGVVIATLIAWLFHPTAPWLIGLAALFSLFCFAFQKVNPTTFAAFLTAFVVFMIATTGLPEGTVTVHRLVNTALGCGLALTSQVIGYRHLLRLFAKWSGDPDGPPYPTEKTS